MKYNILCQFEILQSGQIEMMRKTRARIRAQPTIIFYRTINRNRPSQHRRDQNYQSGELPTALDDKFEFVLAFKFPIQYRNTTDFGTRKPPNQREAVNPLMVSTK